MTFVTAMPWVLSVLTIISMLWCSKSRKGWALAFSSQALWLLWIWASGNTGFLLLTLALCVVYPYNWWTWGRVTGWIVADAQGTRFRCWGWWGPEWTEAREYALLFARRCDAEAFCRDDEDAWRILKVRM